jgi:nucleotide-binding universal stress UspA family protein
MKVLVAIDSSPSSESVLREVRRRLWPAHTEARLLTVVDTSDFAGIKGDLEDFILSEMNAARAMVEFAAEKLSGMGIRVSQDVIDGYPSDGITGYAGQWGADFIFVGSHGHSALARFFLGSVSASILRHAPCSVVIARNPVQSSVMKILLGADGSDSALAAARSVASRPWPAATEFKIVGAVEQVIPAIDPWYAGGIAIERIRQETDRLARSGVSAAQEVLRDAGLRVKAEVLEGHPKTVLMEQAQSWGADLIVAGSHGRKGIARALLGSVSEALAMHAHCSVEVVRQTNRLY